MSEQAFSLWHGVVVVPPQRGVSSEVILAQTAREHSMTVTAMLSPSRQRPYVEARWAAMYRLAEIPKETGRWRTLHEIGREMGGMDHTSILHGLRKLGSPRYADPSTKREAEAA